MARVAGISPSRMATYKEKTLAKPILLKIAKEMTYRMAVANPGRSCNTSAYASECWRTSGISVGVLSETAAIVEALGHVDLALPQLIEHDANAR